MHVCVFTASFPNLSETFILNQILGLIQRGVKIDIVTLVPSTDETVHNEVRTSGLAERLRTAFPTVNPVGRIWHGAGSVFRLLPRHPLVAIRSLNLFAYGRGSWTMNLAAMAEALFSGQNKFDFVMAHFGPFGLLARHLREIGAVSGKSLTFFHGADLSEYVRRHGTDCYDELFRNGELFLPVSDFWACRLKELGCPPEKVHVHHMGVDLNLFACHERGPGAIYHFVTVCRFTEKKGLQYLLEAVSLLQKRMVPRFRVTIGGDGELRESLVEYSKSQGLTDLISFPGNLTRHQVADLLQDADAYVAPSVTAGNGDMEGIPVALMEAMASGLPVISTHHSGIPELIEHGVSGWLTDEKDVEGLAAGMERVMTDVKLRAMFSSNARHQIEQKFNNEKLDEAFYQLLKKQL